MAGKESGDTDSAAQAPHLPSPRRPKGVAKESATPKEGGKAAEGGKGRKESRRKLSFAEPLTPKTTGEGGGSTGRDMGESGPEAAFRGAAVGSSPSASGGSASAKGTPRQRARSHSSGAITVTGPLRGEEVGGQTGDVPTPRRGSSGSEAMTSREGGNVGGSAVGAGGSVGTASPRKKKLSIIQPSEVDLAQAGAEGAFPPEQAEEEAEGMQDPETPRRRRRRRGSRGRGGKTPKASESGNFEDFLNEDAVEQAAEELGVGNKEEGPKVSEGQSPVSPEEVVQV